MAHFAEIDSNNFVLRVIVVGNTIIADGQGGESEQRGIEFCQSLYGSDTRWVQTSYNASFRKNYASLGSVYDINRNAFIPPKPYASWVLNEDTCNWEPPIPRPTDGLYDWDEDTCSWIQFLSFEADSNQN